MAPPDLTGLKTLVLAGTTYLVINGALCLIDDKPELGPQKPVSDDAERASCVAEQSLPEVLYIPDRPIKVELPPQAKPISYHDLEKLVAQKEMNVKSLLEKKVLSSSTSKMPPKVQKRYDFYKKRGWYMDSIERIEKDFGDLISAAAEKYRLPEEIIYGVIIAESNGKVRLRSTKSSAKGLMQILDGTAKELECGNRFNPAQAIDCGVKYLAKMRATFREISPVESLSSEDILSYMVAGYNQGPNGILAKNVRKGTPFWNRNYDATDYVIKARAVAQLVMDYKIQKRELVYH